MKIPLGHSIDVLGPIPLHLHVQRIIPCGWGRIPDLSVFWYVLCSSSSKSRVGHSFLDYLAARHAYHSSKESSVHYCMFSCITFAFFFIYLFFPFHFHSVCFFFWSRKYKRVYIYIYIYIYENPENSVYVWNFSWP